MHTKDIADLLIRDADVVDGGGPAYRADVAIEGGRIVSIVKETWAAGCQRPTARRVLDAEEEALVGRVLADEDQVMAQSAVVRHIDRRAAALRPRQSRTPCAPRLRIRARILAACLMP